ncbi:hypothetical protein AN219_23710 [Streptomyces nanshensis]|nr:hypothetical protein AN219_23710 [Streptomyces nanshensis]
MTRGTARMAGHQNAPTAQQLNFFLTLTEELHFGRSAQRSYISRAAFSQQIAALERRLGLRLVDRTTRRVDLTPAGTALIPHAQAVVAAHDSLHDAARRLHAPAGRLTIGSFGAVTTLAPIPAVLEELRRSVPGLDIRVRRHDFAESPRALLDEDVDAAFLFQPVPPDVQTLPLVTGCRCAALASTDPLAERDALTLADLRHRPVIGWSPAIPKNWRDFWAADPRPDGTPVCYTAHEVADYEDALAVIALGEGIQLPPVSAGTLYPRPGITYVDVKDLPPWTAVLAWLPKNRDKPLVSALRSTAGHALENGPLRYGCS